MFRGQGGDACARPRKLMCYPLNWFVEAWDMDTRVLAGQEDKTLCSKK